jgi:hypothetical protein
MQEIFEYLFKNGGAPGKFKNLLRPLNLDPRSIHLCHQMPNLSGGPVPLTESSLYGVRAVVLIANNHILAEGIVPQRNVGDFLIEFVVTLLCPFKH